MAVANLCEADWTAAVERGAASSLRAHVRARTRALGDQLLGCKDAVKLVEHRQDALLALDRRDAEPAHHADRVGARRAIVGGERVALEQDPADMDLEKGEKGGKVGRRNAGGPAAAFCGLSTLATSRPSSTNPLYPRTCFWATTSARLRRMV